MINGGYPETPDSWIDRNEDDPGDRYYRGGGEREDVISCDTCEREMPVSSPTGNCFICDFEWMAQRQLTFPGNGRLSGGVERLAGAKPDSQRRHAVGAESQSPTCRPNPEIGDGSRITSGNSAPPAQTLQETSTHEINGIVDVIKYLNRRFGINE